MSGLGPGAGPTLVHRSTIVAAFADAQHHLMGNSGAPARIGRVHHASGDAEMLGAARDPVCRKVIGRLEPIAAQTSEGRRFYFCSSSCHAAFVDTPHRYVGWPRNPRGRHMRLPHGWAADDRRARSHSDRARTPFAILTT